MSMSCSLYRVTPEQAKQLASCPESVGELLGNDPVPVPKISFVARLFGKVASGESKVVKTFERISEDDTYCLDQSWHILHFLFAGSGEEADWPSGFILTGGKEIGPDLGYGPTRILTPDQTRMVLNFLVQQSIQVLDSKYVASDIEAAQVYWKPSSEPNERRNQIEELWGVVQGMVEFLNESVGANCSTLIDIF